MYTVEHLDRSEFEPALAWGPGDPLDEAAEMLEEQRLPPEVLEDEAGEPAAATEESAQ